MLFIYSLCKLICRGSQAEDLTVAQERAAKIDATIKAMVPSATLSSESWSNIQKYTLPEDENSTLERMLFEFEKVPNIKVSYLNLIVLSF